MTAYNPDACNTISCCDNRTLTAPIASYVVDTISDLRAMSTSKVKLNEVAQTLGYYSVGDGGGNTFFWSTTSVEVDNAGSIIKSADRTTGRWLALDWSSAEQNALKFGGVDASYRIAAAVNALPATGGTVNAEGFAGAQTFNSDPFGNSTKPVTLLLGSATFTLGVSGYIKPQTGQRVIGNSKTVIELGVTPPSLNFMFYCLGDDIEISNLTLSGGTHAASIISAIYTVGGGNRINIHDVRFDTIKVSSGNIYVVDHTDGKFTNLTIQGRPGGWVLFPSLGAEGHNIMVVNSSPSKDCHQFSNITVRDGGFGLHFEKSNYNSVSNFTATATSHQSAEGINLDASSDNIFTNLNISGRGDGGFVEINGSARNHITGATFSNQYYMGVYSTSTDSVYENIISYNNGFGGASSPFGLWIDSPANRVVLRNIYAFDNQGGSATQTYGITISPGALNTIIESAKFYGNATGEVQDLGTGTLPFYSSGDIVFPAKDKTISLARSAVGINGNNLTVAAGPSSTSGGSVAGGNLSLFGGDGYSGAAPRAGDVFIRGGNNTADSTSRLGNIYFRAGNNTAIGQFDLEGASGDTPLQLLDNIAGTVKRVKLGAVDSGGTGRRALTVVN